MQSEKNKTKQIEIRQRRKAAINLEPWKNRTEARIDVSVILFDMLFDISWCERPSMCVSLSTDDSKMFDVFKNT